MRDLHRCHAPCPCLKKGPQTSFLDSCPGILGHFLCFRRIAGIGLDLNFRHRGRHLYFSDHGLPTGAGWSPISCALGSTLGPRILGSTEEGLIPFSNLPFMHLSRISV